MEFYMQIQPVDVWVSGTGQQTYLLKIPCSYPGGTRLQLFMHGSESIFTHLHKH
jgi:hypothetical protein